MARVTDFRVDRIEIAAQDYWWLPERTRRLIETYSAPVESNGIVRFEIAVYRWEEIQESMRRVTS